MSEPSLLARQAEAAQRRAADPRASAWVAASAGSGKTKVLTDRVLRLLLAGTAPERILCLTFTKAAAAEMADRLFARLSRWASAPAAELEADLAALLGREADRAESGRARRLFARVLDAPESVRIETLHGFAQGILRRFPVEAGVSPTFEVLDERSAAEMLARARERVFRSARPGSAEEAAIAAMSDRVADAEFPKLVAAITGARVRIGRMLRAWGGATAFADGLARHLGLSPGATPEGVLAEACGDAGRDGAGLRALAAAMIEQGGKTEQKRVPGLTAFLAAPAAERPALWDDYVSVFLTDKGLPRDTEKYPTKKVVAAFPDAVAVLTAEQERVLAVQERLAAARLLAATAHLAVLAEAIIAAYAAEKRRAGWLDYDDLIEKALALLSSAEARPWVLYKLDGGLDHILVDEAQDTSPDQWAVVDALSAEFFAGEGARGEIVRTVFAVGDPKQSIYRFQGADPGMFLAQRARVAEAAAEAGAHFEAVPLDISFRSAQAVLDAVDAAFADAAAADGVLDPDRPAEEQRHIAARSRAPGLVEVWPRLPAPEAAEPPAWSPPVERLRVPSAAARCAAILAARIARMVGAQGETPDILESSGRPIRPGDILVLVRKRDAFQTDLIRALKQRGVAVAGADRLNLADHMAVQDCLALAEAALFPGDDLTLAAALKGPFLGWSEDDLFALAHGRGKGVSLWRALLACSEAGARAATERLMAWGEAARRLRPFAFFVRLLEAEGGRARLRQRLGAEADDPLDEFLDLAQGYERAHPGAMQGFLRWFAAGAVEIKRDMDKGAADTVRIMTVHGAKGLQAPIVFLPQTVSFPARAPALDWTQDARGKPLLLWKPPHAVAPDALKRAQAAREAEDERESRRLLYVAMTRAADRLIVCGWDGKRTPSGEVWHDLVWRGVERLTLPQADPELTAAIGAEAKILRWRGLGETESALPAAPAPPPANAPLPAWAALPPPPEPEPSRPLTPSRPDEEPPLPSPLAATGDRFRRGIALHRLLQSLPDLPPAERSGAAERFLAAALADWAEETRKACAAEALAVLDMPDARALFGPDSRAEVAIAGLVDAGGGPRLLAGQVDRLAVTADEVLVADYKTNRPPPATAAEVPPVYRRQLAAYRAALAPVFPGRRVRTFLLWTDGPTLMEIPPEE
jgi:ATP-dependent helicase/nuclease subunit A